MKLWITLASLSLCGLITSYRVRIPIGVIVSPGEEAAVSAVKYAFWMKGQDATSPFLGEVLVETAEDGNVVQLDQAVCRLLKSGIYLLVANTSASNYPILVSYSNEFHLPLVSPSFPETTPDPPAQYGISIKPSTVRAVLDMLRFYKWKSLIYLYDSTDDPEKLQMIFQLGYRVLHARLLGLSRVSQPEEANLYLRKLETSHRNEALHVILDTRAALASEIIVRHVHDVHVRKTNFHFIVAEPVLEDFWTAHPAEFGAVNVTGLHLFPPASQSAHEFLLEWSSLSPNMWPGAGTENIQVSTFLYYDAALVAANTFGKMLHTVPNLFYPKYDRHGNEQDQPQASRDCFSYPAVPLERGQLISNYLKESQVMEATTGVVQLSHNGRRKHISLEVVETVPFGHNVIGSWSDTNGLRISSEPQANHPTPSARIDDRKRFRITTVLGITMESISKVGFSNLLLSRHASDVLLGCHCINKRFLTAKFRTKIKDLNVVCCYASTKDSNENEKDTFYSQLQDILNFVKKEDISLALGDFNSKVRIHSDFWAGVFGPFGIGSSNGNEEVSYSPPFMMIHKGPNGSEVSNNDRFYGYCKDIIDALANEMDFDYDLHLVNDNQYGKFDESRGEWTGMVGELIRGKADMAVSDLFITPLRLRVVDFLDSFQMVSISLMVKNPNTKSSTSSSFFFLASFSPEVWLCFIVAIVVVSLATFFVSRLNGAPDNIEAAAGLWGEKFTLVGSTWFTVGSMLIQNTGVYPRSISSRVLGGTWWCFTLLMVALYIANIATQLYMESMGSENNPKLQQLKSRSLESIIVESVSTGYPVIGFIRNSHTEKFIQASAIPAYKDYWEFLKTQPNSLVDNVVEGVTRVRQSNGEYAFLLQSTANEYHSHQEPCDTVMVPDIIGHREHAIAVPLGSPLQSQLNEALRDIKDRGELQQLYRKWWADDSQCNGNTLRSNRQQGFLTLHSMSGLFYVLLVGIFLLGLFSMAQYYWKAHQREQRRRRLSFEDMTFDKSLPLPPPELLMDPPNEEAEGIIDGWAERNVVPTSFGDHVSANGTSRAS